MIKVKEMTPKNAESRAKAREGWIESTTSDIIATTMHARKAEENRANDKQMHNGNLLCHPQLTKAEKKMYNDIPYFCSTSCFALYDDNWTLNMIDAVVAHTSQEHSASIDGLFSIMEMILPV